MITRMIIYTVYLTIIQNMITSMLQVPLRLCVMGDLCWNSTTGVPTWVTHDAKPQWYSITEAFQIITLVLVVHGFACYTSVTGKHIPPCDIIPMGIDSL